MCKSAEMLVTVVKRGDQVIGHITERLTRILTPMLEDGRLIVGLQDRNGLCLKVSGRQAVV